MTRKGTFWCWLFGHKFIGTKERIVEKRNPIIGDLIETSTHKLDFCVRCGQEEK